MNWYLALKIAQQLGLFGQDPENDAPVNQMQRTLFDTSILPGPQPKLYTGVSLSDDIENNAKTCQDIEYLFEKYGVNWNIVKWPGGAPSLYVFEDGDTYVAECDNNGISLSEANQWVYDLNDLSLDSYVPASDFNEEFWGGVREESRVYHATSSENVESILSSGLTAASETRGLSNRFIGDSVFVSTNPDAIDAYGDAIIEINVWAMSQAGYMPHVSGEEPLSEDEQRKTIAWRLGLEDFHTEDRGWEGLDPETIVFDSGIPAQFLRLLK